MSGMPGNWGMDLHIRDDHFQSYPPVILGHEYVGKVERLGDDVDPTLMDARVVAEPHAAACHVCFLCPGGNPEYLRVQTLTRLGYPRSVRVPRGRAGVAHPPGTG